MRSTTRQSLYERLGGEDAVVALAGDLHERLLTDATIAAFFGDAPAQRRNLASFIGFLAGGPAPYSGLDMRRCLDGGGLGRLEFLTLAGHLDDTLSAAGMAEKDVVQVFDALDALEDDIVGA